MGSYCICSSIEKIKEKEKENEVNNNQIKINLQIQRRFNEEKEKKNDKEILIKNIPIIKRKNHSIISNLDANTVETDLSRRIRPDLVQINQVNIISESVNPFIDINPIVSTQNYYKYFNRMTIILKNL